MLYFLKKKLGNQLGQCIKHSTANLLKINKTDNLVWNIKRLLIHTMTP